MLTHWVRDRTRGPRLPLAHVVKKMTADTADLFGFTDRGVLDVGKRADVNVIDLDDLQLRESRLADDLPAGGTREHDEFTGARPGRLVRS